MKKKWCDSQTKVFWHIPGVGKGTLSFSFSVTWIKSAPVTEHREILTTFKLTPKNIKISNSISTHEFLATLYISHKNIFFKSN